jgi:hypothetical protein
MERQREREREQWLRAKTLQQYVDLTDAQLKALRLNQWVEGVHYVRLNRRAILYNVEKVRKWLQSNRVHIKR